MADVELSLESVLDELICPLCIDTFSQPRSLQCLHSYCEKCLEGLQKATKVSEGVRCPECRAWTELPHGGVKDLPINFKLKRLTSILTVDQEREIMRKRSTRHSRMEVEHPMCPTHNDKPMEFYCKPCETTICGQCMLDDHRVHGRVTYASEVLKLHIMELRSLLPTTEDAILLGEESLLDMRAESGKLADALNISVISVSEYFAELRKILDDRENELLSAVRAQAKKKEKKIRERVAALEDAIDAMRKAKMTLEDTVDRKAKDITVLLEEKRLRGRIQASINAIEAEATDCEAVMGKLSNMTAFSPDPSLKQSCMSLDYCSCFDSPLNFVKKRSLTTGSPTELEQSVKGLRGSFFDNNPIRKRVSNTFGGGLLLNSKMHVADLSPLKSTTLPQVIVDETINVVQPVSVIGKKNLIGSNNHITAYPFGVCSPQKGLLLVTDTKHHLYRVITSTGKCLETVGSEGKGDKQFTEPKGITVDKDGNILVVDGKNPGRIQKFSPVGKYITKFKVKGMVEPIDLVTLDNGNILVTDGAKACVHVLEDTGKYRGLFGNLTNLKCPAGITAGENRVVVADSGGHCLYILTAYGQLLTRMGGGGAGPGDLYVPYGVALDKQGNIFVSELTNHKISVFTPGGNFLMDFGCKGSDAGMFHDPKLICFNHQGVLVVCDEQNQRIQLFNPTNIERTNE